MRTQKTYQLNSVKNFKTSLLAWAQQFETALWLDSNQYHQKYSSFDAVLAVEEFTSLKTDYTNSFEQLKEYQSITNDWIFGYLSYDLKNDVESLQSKNTSVLDFADLYFFQPQKLFLIKEDLVELHYLKMVDDEIDSDFEAILNFNTDIKSSFETDTVKIKLTLSKDDYLQRVQQILNHIHRGDIYEANFCQEFFAEDVRINPYEVYKKLNAISNPPFAAFFKHQDQYALCASPERYLKKDGEKLISQPIKGTAKRSKDKTKDDALKQHLEEDVKERSENIMIVDLVRNDLSLTAQKNSVQVEELCKIYTFDQVHQMVSTVVSKLKPDIHPIDAIKTTFPMGSMTGAPKISAMQIIEDQEVSKRGLYSGAIGYITPENNFDFNVVIRSILYKASKQYVSYSVGSAITAKSNPVKEYEECLLKAKAMRQALEN
ncbi:aminodeoxychorismate synthase component I [Aurantibacter aestuarii]|uniref:Aminodeoxychorismate synthase, component I n=1 Tax=Aurantibacter aestuarii TaxID=1266046 RepID=A0A2T1N9A9_9FLAO|nr:aminodeoxychorismate synthase component I [Aurantibacter aestuarii]PSG88422.1 aminodeoxychorismate synthase, component I [Aurantibacter aestuarii]